MARTVHPTYLCPNCLKPHQKDAPLSIFMANVSDARTINFSDMRTLPVPLRRIRNCGACGGTLDLPALVAGKLDFYGWGWRLGLAAAVGVFGGLLMLETPPELPLIGLAAALAGLVVWFATDTAERARIAQYRKTID
jgi:hypothetical protein